MNAHVRLLARNAPPPPSPSWGTIAPVYPPPLAVEAEGAAAIEAALGAEVDAQGASGQGRGGQEEEEEEEGAQGRQEGAHGALRREGRGGWLRWGRGIPGGGGEGYSSHGITETIPPKYTSSRGGVVSILNKKKNTEKVLRRAIRRRGPKAKCHAAEASEIDSAHWSVPNHSEFHGRVCTTILLYVRRCMGEWACV